MTTDPRKTRVVTKFSDGTLAVTCAFCNGGGIDPDSDYIPDEFDDTYLCRVCNGKAIVTVVVPDDSFLVPCNCCARTGKESFYIDPYSIIPCRVCNGYGFINFYTGVQSVQPNTDTVDASHYSSSPPQKIESLLHKFHLVAQKLRKRYKNRATIEIVDEYDVQDLLYALLQVEFSDIRREDPSPNSCWCSFACRLCAEE